MAEYTLEFFEDDDGSQPVLRWLREELAPQQRRVLGFAMKEVLQAEGVAVCGTPFGDNLGGGVFEFRVGGAVGEYLERKSATGGATGRPAEKDEKLLLRVFCHAHGNKLILLLAGYDKLANSSKTHQNKQIQLARQRLRAWQLRQNRAKARAGRRSSP